MGTLRRPSKRFDPVTRPDQLGPGVVEVRLSSHRAASLRRRTSAFSCHGGCGCRGVDDLDIAAEDSVPFPWAPGGGGALVISLRRRRWGARAEAISDALTWGRIPSSGRGGSNRYRSAVAGWHCLQRGCLSSKLICCVRRIEGNGVTPPRTMRTDGGGRPREGGRPPWRSAKAGSRWAVR